MHKEVGLGSMVLFESPSTRKKLKSLVYIGNQESEESKLPNNTCKGLGGSDGFRGFAKRHG